LRQFAPHLIAQRVNQDIRRLRFAHSGRYNTGEEIALPRIVGQTKPISFQPMGESCDELIAQITEMPAGKRYQLIERIIIASKLKKYVDTIFFPSLKY